MLYILNSHVIHSMTIIYKPYENYIKHFFPLQFVDSILDKYCD